MVIIEFISTYDFLIYALVVGALVALCAALLGTSLVLRRLSMIGDGLSHVAFGAVTLAAALNAQPLYVALPIVIIAAFLLLRAGEKGVGGDSGIAIISTSALAIGVIIVSLTSSSVDMTSYLFGSILSVTASDLPLSIALCALVLLLYIFFYNKIFAVTFDESFAKATGIRTSLYNMLIAALTAVTIVLGMRLMGAMLISCFIIFPSLTSMKLAKTFKVVIASSAVLSVVSVVLGIVISCLVDNMPTGAVIVAVNLVFYLVASVIARIKKR